MRNITRCGLTTLLAVLSCPVAHGFEKAETAGIHRQVATLGNGVKIRYTIAIPKTYTPTRPVPLILALHYGGEVTPFFGAGVLRQLVEPAMRELEAIIVAPDCPASSWTDPAAEPLVIQLLQGLMQIYPIDRDRILLTGYSRGAAGTWHFAGRYPDLFSAAIPISGAPREDAPEMPGRPPFFVIHSRQDERVPLSRVQKAVEGLRKQNAPVEFLVVDGPTHYDFPAFISPLQSSLPWVRKVWEKSK